MKIFFLYFVINTPFIQPFAIHSFVKKSLSVLSFIKSVRQEGGRNIVRDFGKNVGEKNTITHVDKEKDDNMSLRD